MPFAREFENTPLGIQAGDAPLYKAYTPLCYSEWTGTLTAGLYCAIVGGLPVAINAQAVTTPVLGVVKRDQASYIADTPVGYTFGDVEINEVTIFNGGYALVTISSNATDIAGIAYGVKVWAEATSPSDLGKAKVLNTDGLALDPNSIFVKEMSAGVWLVKRTGA